MKDLLARAPGGWLDRLRYVWYPLSILGPLAMVVLAFLGYYYTAQQLQDRLRDTIMLVLVVVGVYAMIIRWLFLARRRLAVEKAQRRREAIQAGAESAEPHDAETDVATEDAPEASLVQLNIQTRQLVRVATAVALVFGIWPIWVDVLPALGLLNDVLLWSAGDRMVTLADVLVAVALALVTVAASKNVPALLEIAVLQRLPMDPGGRFAITTIARYIIVIVGVVVSFGAIGVTWGSVQWLAAGLTVGLGFGLQEIFANFISGLILLLERPMRVGDTVTVGTVSGKVTKIRIRATTIVDWDRKELIVPNKSFITGQLINWSLSDNILRIVIDVGVAYGSDTELAHKLLMQVAKDHAGVLDEPAPSVIFKNFGASSLDFQLRAYIPNIGALMGTRHELNMAIDKAFREAGVEIAFPQQDIHVRTVEGSVSLLPKPEKPSD